MNREIDTIYKHIEILQEYFKIHREYTEVIQVEPQDEWGGNNKQVRLLELEQETIKLSEQLGDSVIDLSEVALVLRRNTLENSKNKYA